MIPATTHESLVEKCLSLAHNGAEGVLISGGCDEEGKVPLFFDALREIKKRTGLILNVHTGFVDEKNFAALRTARPHYLSFDIPTEYALKNVYRLNRRSQDYMDSLSLLRKAGLSVVPHVCLGMNGNSEEEKKIIEKVSRIVDKIVLNIVFPTRGTDFEKVKSNAEEIISIFKYARPMFKRMILGCMRPRKRKIEEEAVMLDGIVQPTRWARKKARELNLRIREKNSCCVVD